MNDERVVSRATAKARSAEAPSARLRGSDANANAKAKAKARKPSRPKAVDALAVVDASPHKRAPNAPVTAAEIAEGLGLSELRGRRWHCQSAVATQGLGLYEGLDWLSGTLKSMQSRGLRTSVGTSGAKGTNFSAAGVKKSVMSFF